MGSVSRQQGETIISAHSTLRESFTASDYAENHQIPRNFAGVTLAAVLEDESKSAANGATVQTLFDIIRAEERPSNHQTDKKTWKSLKERFKLRRNNNSNAEANSFNSESARVDDGQRIQRSSRMRLFDALEAERERIRVSSIEPVRMSLMEVLDGSTESPTGIQGPENQSDENEEGAEEEEEEEEVDLVEVKGGGGAAMAEMACCVCMVRHKGAAFIPCGHTFCRLCSREVWVQRGNCPLCNNSILEILDIF